MEDIFETDENSTPLTQEEKEQLKIKWVVTRGELNELETKGIAEAEIWLLRNKKDVLSEVFIKTLHKKMFGGVWKWAGIFRKTERNIGVAPYEIQPKIRLLLEDVRYWITNSTYDEKEIAIRFHHILVQIHPFANGNGRISRIMANLVMRKISQRDLSWGVGNLGEVSVVRKRYIEALQRADEGDYTKLLEFVEVV